MHSLVIRLLSRLRQSAHHEARHLYQLHVSSCLAVAWCWCERPSAIAIIDNLTPWLAVC